MKLPRPPAALAAGLALIALAACTRDGPDALMASARDYMARSDYSAASIQARNAVKAQPDSAEARLLLGKALLKANDPVAAENELRRALELGGSRDEVLPLLAQAMLGSGRAEAFVREFADKPPAAGAARANFETALGDAYAVLRRRDEAVRAYRDALATDPGHAGARLGLAQLDAQAGQLDSALRETEAVIAADPKNAKAYALKSDILLAKRDAAGAKRALEQAVQADAAYLPARYALVSTLIDEGAYDAARDQLAAVQKISSDDIRLYYFQSALAFRTGDLGTARDKVGQILKAAPDHVPSLVLAAKIALQTEQFASAEANLRRALAQAPDHPEARRLLAASYLRSGQAAKARQELQPLLAAREVPDAHLLILAGEASLAGGDIKQATAFYQQAAAKAPKTEAAAAHTRLGQIAMATGRHDEGVRELESAASIDPAFRETDLALISTYLRNGETDKALAAARALEKKNPKDPMSHQLLGVVYLAKRDTSSARASFERALSINPGHVPAARALAELDVADKKCRRRTQTLRGDDREGPAQRHAASRARRASAADWREARRCRANAEERGGRGSLVDRRAPCADLRAGAVRRHARRAIGGAGGECGPSRPGSGAADARHPAVGSRRPAAVARDAAQAGAGATRRAGGPLQRVAAVQAGKKQYDRAAETLRLAKEVAPGDLTVSRDLIVLYLTAGRPDDALKEARAVQTGSPRNAAGWLLESQVHETQRRFDESEKALRQGLKVEPDSGLIAARLHGAMVAGGKDADADGFVRKWIADHPKDTVLRTAAGRSRTGGEELQDGGRALPGGAGGGSEQRHCTQQPRVDRRADQRSESAAVRGARGEAGAGQCGGARHDGIAAGRQGRGAARCGLPGTCGRGSRRIARDIRLNYAKGLMRAGQKDVARRELEALQAAPNDFQGKSEVTALLNVL